MFSIGFLSEKKKILAHVGEKTSWYKKQHDKKIHLFGRKGEQVCKTLSFKTYILKVLMSSQDEYLSFPPKLSTSDKVLLCLPLTHLPHCFIRDG